MKFCTHCGKELFDEAVICPGCGCQAEPQGQSDFRQASGAHPLVVKLAEKVKTNAIIWLIIGLLQCLSGVLIIVGILNIMSSIKDMNYSKNLPQNPVNIVATFEPVSMPIIVFVYNLIFGGVIGVVGSIYYFVAIRGFVMENRTVFDEIDAQSGTL